MFINIYYICKYMNSGNCEIVNQYQPVQNMWEKTRVERQGVSF